jgi:SNF2 family DNA or RNA helicase
VKSHLVEHRGFKHREIIGYKNVDHLKKKLREHGCVFMKTEEVLDLPSQTFTISKVNKSQYYNRFMKNRIIAIGDEILVGDNSLTKLLYARQLCGAYNKAKLDAFKDIVDSTSQRLIVFYNFTKELDALKKCCSDRPISIVNGETKDLIAYENCNDSITFIQYQAGAYGLNLQKSNHIVYFTLPLSSEMFEQSKKRIHRIGQEKPCFYTIMMCNGSVEEKIYNTLKMRKNYTDKLFEEDYH